MAWASTPSPRSTTGASPGRASTPPRGLGSRSRQASPNLACQHRAFLAQIAAIRGPEDEARRLGEEVLAEATARGLRGTVAFAGRALVQRALATGRLEVALVQLEAMSALRADIASSCTRATSR